MPNTLQQSVNFAQSFIGYSSISSGAGSEPAISVGSMVRSIILNAPFTWPWNRSENSSLATVAPVAGVGTQNYTVALTDFGFLEKVSLTDVNGKIVELKDVYNTSPRGLSNDFQRPTAAAVESVIYGTSLVIRFMGCPDAVYTATLTYQRLALPFMSLGGTWAPIPDSYIDVYNNLFLAESLASYDDARSAIYRQRGAAALLSKAEGLSEMQRSAFLEQFLARDQQTLSAQLRGQQGNQARGI